MRLCVGNPDLHPDAWMENHGGHWLSDENKAAAMACLRCPAVVDCLAEALRAEGRAVTHHRDGIFGGWLPGMRAALARGQRPRWPAHLKPPTRRLLRDIGNAALMRAAA